MADDGKSTSRLLTKEEKEDLPAYHTHTDTAQKIAALNDRLRKQGDPELGAIHLSAMASRLSEEKRSLLIQKMQAFDDFRHENDPYGEHDYARFYSLDGMDYMFKIDYYNRSTRYGLSSDPSSISATHRVLTIYSFDEM